MTRPAWTLRRRRGDERGQGLVELTMVTPIVLLLLAGIVEFGMAYNDLLTIGYGSREGARVGSALANGGVSNCAAGTDPNKVDPSVIAAVQRILKSPGSDVELGDVREIRIFKATSAGTPSGSAINVWSYTPGTGPDVDPGAGSIKVDFSETSHGWNVCSRVNSGTDPDSIGVQVVYGYRLTSPLAALVELVGGRQAATITFRETTVMALNPSS